MGVSEHSTSFLKYLDKSGLVLGCQLIVMELNDFDQSVLVKINDEITHFLSHEVAKNLLIKFN